MRTQVGLVLLAALLIGGCTNGGSMSITSAASPTERVNLAALASMNEDCLQYLVETRGDGTELWYADYPYFYLMDAGTEKATLDDKGRPLADALLYRQAVAFMARHPGLEGRTAWGVRLARYEQLVRDGKELSRSEVKWVEEFDLDELRRKDAETRKSVSGEK